MLTLYRFEYSCYARKVQMALDLSGQPYSVMEVPYLDRSALVELTGGYMQVPVLGLESGGTIVDSRKICEYLTQISGHTLLPTPWQGPIWAYADWCDSLLEDTLFRIASPDIVSKVFTRPAERALFTFIKERKFGTGCIDQWVAKQSELLARADEQLRPTCISLAHNPFVFGERPTLADAALYGGLAMLARANGRLLAGFEPVLLDWMRRIEAVAAQRGQRL